MPFTAALPRVPPANFNAIRAALDALLGVMASAPDCGRIEDDPSYVERLAGALVATVSAFTGAKLKINIIDVDSWLTEKGAESWARQLVQKGFDPPLTVLELTRWLAQTNDEQDRPAGDPVFFFQMRSWLKEFRDAVLLRIRPPFPPPAPGWEGHPPEHTIQTVADFVAWLDFVIETKEKYLPLSPIGLEVRKGNADGRTLRNAYRLIDKIGLLGMPAQRSGTLAFLDEVAELRNIRRVCREKQSQSPADNATIPPNQRGAEQGEAAVTGRDQGEAGQAEGAAVELAPSRQKALSQYLDALSKCPHLKGATDREVYDWLREHSDADTFPEFATWGRYLRDARKATGTGKYTPRSGRTGRSVVRPDEI